MQTELRARELMKMGLNVKIMLIGKKGATYFKRRSEIFNIAGVLRSLQGNAVGQLGGASLPGLLGTPWLQRGLQSRWGKLQRQAAHCRGQCLLDVGDAALRNSDEHAHSTKCCCTPAAHSSFALACLLSAANAHCCWQLTDCNCRTAGTS